MDILDRLGWAAGISLRAYGVRVGVRVNDPGMLDTLIPSFPPGWKPAKTAIVDRLYSIWVATNTGKTRIQRFHMLFGDVEQLDHSLDLGMLISSFESDFHRYIAENARNCIFVHAGVVGWKGRAILIPGKTLSGKSSLVAALVKRGATYYSDEFAVLDGKGRVHPFARPLGMRSHDMQTQRKVEASALGGKYGKDPLPVGLVISCRYKAGTVWRPRRLSPGQAALVLLGNTVAARHKPLEALSTFEKLVLEVPVLKGVRGEAGKTAGDILNALK